MQFLTPSILAPQRFPVSLFLQTSMRGEGGFQLSDASLQHIAFHLVFGLGPREELSFHVGQLGAGLFEGEQALVLYFVGQFMFHGSTP